MHYFRMAPQPSSSSTKPLNPFAPIYTPLSFRWTAPPPSAAPYFPASSPPPPPVYLLPFSLRSFHTHYFTYRNPFPPNPPPPSPPQAEVVIPPERSVGENGRRPDLKRPKVEKTLNRIFPTNVTKNPTCVIKEERKRNRHHQVVPLNHNEEKTTIMIKNIPYDCTREKLITMLDEFCSVENHKAKNEGATSRNEGVVTFAYDFIYLPIDFRTKRGRGFAFVNFTNAGAVWKFFDAFNNTNWHFIHGQKWSKKIEIFCAILQGKEALANHFWGSLFECETDEFLPAVFSPPRDGSGQPVQLTVVGNRRAPSARYNHFF